jgi:hypothetical protein
MRVFINTIKVNSMNYSKIYNNIIENAKSKSYNGYTEKHHIIPRSLGGSNDPSNLVELSAREHFVCHYLLIKIHRNNQTKFHKMIKAFTMMLCSSPSQKNHRYCPSRKYEFLRNEYSKAQSLGQLGTNNSQYGTKWITNLVEEKKINKNLPIPEGWYIGRKSKYEILKRNQEETLLKKQEHELMRENARKELRALYEIYNKYGFNKLVEMTSYAYSSQNLVAAFKRHLPEFVPQNGKRRGTK